MSIFITILIIALILFRTVKGLLPSTPINQDEDDRGYTPDQILKNNTTPHSTPQPQKVNINKNPTKSQEVKPQIIEEQPEELTFNNEDIRKGIIFSEILNRKNI